MASRRQDLAARHNGMKRELFDYKVGQLGEENLSVYITRDEIQNPNVIFNDPTPVVNVTERTLTTIIKYPPGGIQIHTKRHGDINVLELTSTSTSFYQVLPIELYVKFADRVVSGDIIIDKQTDEDGNPFFIPLEINNIEADFNEGLIWKKYSAAIRHEELPPEVITLLQTI